MKKLMTVVLAMALAACTQSNGSEFLGKWVRTDTPLKTLEIERNGDNFLIRETRPAYKNMFYSEPGNTHTDTIPAVWKDGMLQISTGMGTTNLSYIKQRDTLLLPGRPEYKRVK